MATFKPVARNIAKTPTSSQEYLAMIDELNKLRRPTDVAMGFGTDKAPNAYTLQGKAVNQILPGSQVQTPITPTTQVSNVYQTQEQPITDAQQRYEQNKPESIRLMERITKASKPQEVGKDQNGNTYYSDGTVKDTSGLVTDTQGNFVRQDPEIVAVVNGYSITRDGQVLKYNEDTFNAQNTSELLFGGKNYVVTQQFGNYNPNKYYTTHQGEDIGVVKAPISLPMDTKVVGTLQDGNGDQGYGNSLLVQLPTGEMLRFSHLNSLNFRQGDTIPANTVMGITGSTGNSTGYHLDVEYINNNGQRQNPESLINRIAQNPQQYGVKTSDYSAISYADVPQEVKQEAFNWKATDGKITEQDRQQFPNEVAQAEQKKLSSNQALQNRINQRVAYDNFNQAITNPNPNLGNILETGVSAIGSATGISGTGLSELAGGDVKGASTELSGTLAGIGQKAGLKDYGISESILALGDVLNNAKNYAFGNKDQNVQNIQTADNAPTNPMDTVNKGLNVLTGIQNVTGAISNPAGEIFNNARSLAQKTITDAIQGIVPKAYAETNNPLQELGGSPVGQSGASGDVLTSGVAPSNISTQNIQNNQNISNQNKTVSGGQSSQNPFVQTQPYTSATNKQGTSTSKSTSSSQNKSTQKTTAPAKTTQPTQTSQKLPTSSASNKVNPYSPSQQNTVYGFKVSTPQPQSKAPTKVQAPAPKTSVFKRAVSVIKSFFKK